MSIHKKLSDGETVFVFLDVQNVVARLIPNSDYTIVKFKGGQPYSIKDDTNLATDCRLFGTEITESEFDKY